MRQRFVSNSRDLKVVRATALLTVDRLVTETEIRRAQMDPYFPSGAWRPLLLLLPDL